MFISSIPVSQSFSVRNKTVGHIPPPDLLKKTKRPRRWCPKRPNGTSRTARTFARSDNGGHGIRAPWHVWMIQCDPMCTLVNFIHNPCLIHKSIIPIEFNPISIIKIINHKPCFPIEFWPIQSSHRMLVWTFLLGQRLLSATDQPFVSKYSSAGMTVVIWHG